MFARCARIEPALMRACSLSWYFTDSCLSFCSTDTPGAIAIVSAPLAPLTVTLPAATLTLTPLGRSMTRLATLDISAHLVSARAHQATMHRTSPPWPIACAALSVITPLGVDTITVPMPPSTRGISSLPR